MTLSQSALNSPSGIYQHQANRESAWQQNTWMRHYWYHLICSTSICGFVFSPRLDKDGIRSKTATILKMVVLLHLWYMDFRLPAEQKYNPGVWRKTDETTVCALLILMLLSATKLRVPGSHCSYNTKMFKIISLIEWTEAWKTHKYFIGRGVRIKFCKLLETIHILQKVLEQP